MRVCLEPACPTLVQTGRCRTHRSDRERLRGTRQARGYGADHEAERARWAPLVATGHVKCWRCRRPLDPAEPWDLGHDDHNRSVYRGPECQPCNRATAGRISPSA